MREFFSDQDFDPEKARQSIKAIYYAPAAETTQTVSSIGTTSFGDELQKEVADCDIWPPLVSVDPDTLVISDIDTHTSIAHDIDGRIYTWPSASEDEDHGSTTNSDEGDTLSNQGDQPLANDGYSQTEQKLMLEKAQLESRAELTAAVQLIKDLVRDQGDAVSGKVGALADQINDLDRDVQIVKGSTDVTQWIIGVGLAVVAVVVGLSTAFMGSYISGLESHTTNRINDLRENVKSDSKLQVQEELSKQAPKPAMPQGSHK